MPSGYAMANAAKTGAASDRERPQRTCPCADALPAMPSVTIPANDTAFASAASSPVGVRVTCSNSSAGWRCVGPATFGRR